MTGSLRSKVWFITGAGRGFDREFATAAPARGDRVAANARDTWALSDLVSEHGAAVLPLRLVVTDGGAVFAAVAAAHEAFGRLDVVFGAGMVEFVERQYADRLTA